MFVDIYRSFTLIPFLLETRNQYNCVNLCNNNNITDNINSDFNNDINDDRYNFNKYIDSNNERFKDIENKIDKIIENERSVNYNTIKLLTSEITYEWARTWIYDMVNIQTQFPQFMYQDMFIMRDYSMRHSNTLYFYISYYPADIPGTYGPYFISALKLIPEKKQLMTDMIIQNPNLVQDYGDNPRYLIDFKYELEKLSIDSGVFFKFNNLKKLENKRYYYSWLYEI